MNEIFEIPVLCPEKKAQFRYNSRKFFQRSNGGEKCIGAHCPNILTPVFFAVTEK